VQRAGVIAVTHRDVDRPPPPGPVFYEEGVSGKAWTIYCPRDIFQVCDIENSRLCSLHFSKEQVARDLEKMKENGYVGAQGAYLQNILRLRLNFVNTAMHFCFVSHIF
jgi:hypothetical protein